MKKTLILSTVLTLTLLVATSASAAVHNFRSDFENLNMMPDFNEAWIPGFEGWYYIQKEGPSATVRGAFSDSRTHIGAEYFKNDQTFANLSYCDWDGFDSRLYLKGSYLFDNNFFVGLDYGSGDDFSQVTLSPGYRFNLAKKAGYVAVSMDYAANDDYYVDSGIVDFEVNGRYYTKTSRVYGQLTIPNEDVTGTDELDLFVGGAFKYSKNVVLGANFWRNGDITKFDLGCTTGFDKLGLEFKYENDDKDDNLYFNALYSLTNKFRAGMQINKKENADDPYLFAKFRYTVNSKNSLVLVHRFENDSAVAVDEGEALTCLRWDINL